MTQAKVAADTFTYNEVLDATLEKSSDFSPVLFCQVFLALDIIQSWTRKAYASLICNAWIVAGGCKIKAITWWHLAT